MNQFDIIAELSLQQMRHTERQRPSSAVAIDLFKANRVLNS